MFGKLKSKLLLIFLIIGVLPILVVGYLALSKTSEALQQQAFAQLVSMREVKKTQLETYFNRAFNDIRILSGSEDAKQIQKLMRFYAFDEEVTKNDAFPIDTYEYEDIWETHGKTLADYVNVYGYDDVLIIQADTGHVVYTANKRSDLGANLNTGELKNSPLATVFNKALRTKDVAVQDYQRYSAIENKPVSFIAHPINDLAGEMLAVAVLELSFDELNRIMLQRTGMRETGETYLVGQDFLMRSDSYLSPETHSVLASFENPEIGRLETSASKNALAGKTAFEIIPDYRGVPVLSAYTPIKFGENNWALIAEIDEAEAFDSITSLKNLVLIVLIVLIGGVVIISIIALVVTRSVTVPVKALTDRLTDVAINGDFSARVAVNSKDEIGQSARAFNTLMDSMQAAIGEIRKVMEGLADGDFSIRIKSEYSGDLLLIKQATNTSLENIEETESIKAELEQEAKVQSEENARVRQALDNVSTNAMIADRNYDIIYMNRSSKALMQEARDDFATLVPHFDPDNILGQNIDFFHRNPNHQRHILEHLQGTHNVELSVGERIMAIASSAIIDDNGERIGTVIEWTDRTAEVAIERNIDGVVDAASRGDFSKQLSLEDKQGFLLNLAQGLNTLTANTDTALADVQRIFGSMASGDLTERIEKSYAGRFGQLKSDTNSTIEKLTQVIGDIRRASVTIANSSNEIASGNRDLSQRTENQATSLQETAAAWKT
nr:HAMP domain-containing protein [Enterovibrio nigricans]